MLFKIVSTLILLTFSFYSTCVANDVWTENVEILQLNFETFNKTIEDNSNVLVNFYTPNCPHCQRLKPVYSNLAKQLATLKPNLRLAMVDVSIERDLAKQNNIKGIPTLLLFRQQRPTMEYMKQYDVDLISEWLLRKINEPVRNVASVEEARTLLEAHKVVIFGFFDNLSTTKARNFLTLADQADDHVYALTTNPDVHRHYHVQSNSVFVCLNYPLDDDVLKMPDTSSVESMQEFILKHSLPQPTREILDHYYQRVLDDTDYTRSYLFIFLSESSGHYNDSHLSNATQICKEMLRERIYCVTVNVDDDNNQKYMKQFDVSANAIPTIRYVFFGDEKVEVQKMAGKGFEMDNLQYFSRSLVEAYYFKNMPGETLPADWDVGPVKTLVTKNYFNITEKSDKDVAILYHAKWDIGSNKLYPIWEQIGKKYENDTTLIIAKIDTSKNEFEATYYLDKLPVIKLFHRGGKHSITYKGTLEAKWIEKFIDSHRSKLTEKKPTEEEVKDEL